MTATVLYTTDLEPITVIDVPQWALDRMRTGETIVFPVWDDLRVTPVSGPPSKAPLRTVEVWAEPFCRGAARSVLLLTNNDELALLLRSDVLPGQRRAHQDQFQRGFIHGLLSALGSKDN